MSTPSTRLAGRVGDTLADLVRRLRSGEFQRFFRFAVVGGSGVAVNMGFATLGYHVLFAGVSPTLLPHISTFFGIVVSIFTNFLLNDLWTWGDRPKHGRADWFRRLGLYYVFAGFGVLVQWLVMSTLHVWLLEWPYPIANLLGIGAGVLINYEVNNRFTFKERSVPS